MIYLNSIYLHELVIKSDKLIVDHSISSDEKSH